MASDNHNPRFKDFEELIGDKPSAIRDRVAEILMAHGEGSQYWVCECGAELRGGTRYVAVNTHRADVLVSELGLTDAMCARVTTPTGASTDTADKESPPLGLSEGDQSL